MQVFVGQQHSNQKIIIVKVVVLEINVLLSVFSRTLYGKEVAYLWNSVRKD